MAKNKETVLQEKLFELLKSVIKEPYYTGMEVAVPYKHVYLPSEQKPKLQIWCFKQDLVIYKPLFSEKPEINGFEVSLKGDPGKKGIPYVIVEIKNGQPQTDNILAYSQKAEMIKSIFPYCRYIMLVNEKCHPRTYRLGTIFNEIIHLKDDNDQKETETIKRKVLSHLKEAEELVSRM